MRHLLVSIGLPAIVGGLIGAALAFAIQWNAGAAKQQPVEKTPQQRIDETFDALGLQRRPLPPGWKVEP